MRLISGMIVIDVLTRRGRFRYILDASDEGKEFKLLSQLAKQVKEDLLTTREAGAICNEILGR